MMMQKQLSSVAPAQTADIPAIVTLERNYYGTEGYPAGFLYQSLAQWPEGLLVAKQAQHFVGYALVVPAHTSTEFWLMAALVAEHARGQGIGKVLCEKAIAACAKLGASKLWLSVAPDNFAALNLYQKLGFAEAGGQTDFLGPGEDRLLMQLGIS